MFFPEHVWDDNERPSGQDRRIGTENKQGPDGLDGRAMECQQLFMQQAAPATGHTRPPQSR